MVLRVWINSRPDMRMIVSLPGYDAGPNLADEYKSLDSNWAPLRIVQRIDGYWTNGSGKYWYARVDGLRIPAEGSWLVYVHNVDGRVENLFGHIDTNGVWWSTADFSGNPNIPVRAVVFEMSQ